MIQDIIAPAHVAQPPVAQAQPPAFGPNLSNLIEVIVRGESPNIEALEKLLAMQERMDAKAAERAYASAMAAVQAEIDPVRKNQQGAHKVKYADLAAIHRTAMPVLTQYGLSVSFRPVDAPQGMVGVECAVSHSDGHTERQTLRLPVDAMGGKAAVHAYASALTYARRYLFSMAFNIATEDDDGCAAAGYQSPQQRQQQAPPPAQRRQEPDAPPAQRQQPPQDEPPLAQNDDAKQAAVDAGRTLRREIDAAWDSVEANEVFKKHQGLVRAIESFNPDWMVALRKAANAKSALPPSPLCEVEAA